MTLLERLREVECDRQPFTPEHASCVCRLTNEAANEIERLRDLLRRADNVVTWETTPNGSGFQDEIEAALGIK